MRFSEFNAVFNPNNDKVYFSNAEYTSTEKKRYLSFIELANEIRSGKISNLEIGYDIQEPFLLVEIKDKRFIEFIKSTSTLNAYIIKAQDTYQLLLNRTSDMKNLTEYTTNILIRANIKVPTPKSKPSIVLPFKSATNSSLLLKDITEVYEKDVKSLDDIPFELKPIAPTSFSNYSYPFPIRTKTLEHLNKIILHVKPLAQSYSDLCAIINAINVLYCLAPLSSDEMKELLEGDQIVTKSFFENESIRYDNIAKYLIKKFYIKYNEMDNNLYYYDEVKKVYTSDDNFIRAVTGSLSSVLKTQHIDEVMETIRRITYINKVGFNTNEFTVLFKNGVFDLVTGNFTEMSPNVLETNLINAEFHSSVRKNQFVDDFFEKITSGDGAVAQLLYEAIGYSLFRTSEFQVAFILYGGGKNGKSTLFDMLRAIVGRKNATNISFKDLANTFRPSMMENKLVSIAPDISSSDLEDSDVMKSIIAGEDVTLEAKNKDPRNRPLYCTMWFGCNKLPRTSDNSYGFYRRFIVIPMKADLSKVSRGDGKKFHDKLLTQENMDYVANVALRAFFKLYHKTNEFTMPAIVQKETEYYRDISDSARQFVKAKLEDGSYTLAKLKTLSADNIYAAYRSFCDLRGNKCKALNSFETSFEAYKDELNKKAATP